MPNLTSDHRKTDNGHLALAASQEARTLQTQEVGNALVRKLQTTLDPEQLLHWFIDGLQPVFGSLRCNFSSEPFSTSVGKARKTHHSVNYNLKLEGKAMGQIEFRRNNRFSEEELGSLEALLGYLVYPLRNALQYMEAVNAAMSDPLTGVANKRSFDYQIHREVAQSRRYGSVLSLVALDIDFFKKINDTYGHAAGDAVLRQITTVLEDNVRDTDMVFRLGGEEFCLLLPKTDTDGALAIAERVRLAVEGTVFCYDGQKIEVTISLGVASHQGNESRGSLLERADMALYSAKHQGRNRSVLAKDYLIERSLEQEDSLRVQELRKAGD